MSHCKLKDHIRIKHGYAFDGEFFSEEDNGVVLLTPGNFAIGGGFQQGKKYYTGEYPEDFVLVPGDLIVTMTDLSKAIDTLGYAALVPNDGRVFLHNQRIGLIEFLDEEIDKGYLHYLLRSHHYQRTIAGSSSGSTVHHTSPDKICSYEFELPSKDEQIRIGQILSAYETLIENNRKQIKLLEEAVQRLYKEWFIDLHFPKYESTHIDLRTGLPEGWRMQSLSRIGYYLNGYAFKPTDHFDTGFPIIKIRELKNGIRPDTPRNSGEDVPEKYFISKGDIVFSWSATLAIDVWKYETGLLNQHLFKVTHDGYPREFVVQSIDSKITEMKGRTTGSTMTHLQRNKLDAISVPVPDEATMSLFAKLAEPLREEILKLEEQNTDLEEAQKRLLPKLMEGEVRL